MDRLGIGQAIIVGHSFGGRWRRPSRSNYPEKTRGPACFCLGATHPWPGGATSWYYSLTALPVIGWLFSETSPIRPARCAWPRRRTASSRPTRCRTAISDRASIALVLRPAAFRANADRRRGPLPLRARQRAALQGDRGADRGDLRRQRHGRLRRDPFASGWRATFPAPNWSG